MKKSDELRLKTRKMIAKNLIILVALAVVAFVGAFSWFRDDPDANATGITAKAEVSESIEYYIVEPSDSDQYIGINTLLANNATSNAQNSGIAGYDLLNEKWNEGAVTFDSSTQEFRFLSNLFMNEVTSDGLTSFKKPDLLQYGDVAIVDTAEAFDNAVANRDYLSFDIYFRSKERCQIDLKSSTRLAPNGNIDNTEEGMKNAAIGAVRMSVINNNTRQLLWLPAPCIFYDSIGQFYSAGDPNSGTKQVLTGLTASEFAGKGNVVRGNGSDDYIYRNDGTNKHVYYEDTGSSRVLRTIDSATTGFVASEAGNYQLGTDRPLVELNRTGHASDGQTEDGYYYGYVRVNIWIEGEDAESRLDMVGGQFNLTFNADIRDS